MSKEFFKFKRKIQIEALLKALAVGISTSLLIIGGMLLTFKLLGKSLAIWIYILAGILIFLFTSFIYYLIIRPKDTKVAKRLDNELNLNERVQTMIEYQNDDSVMLGIQRETTNEILSKIEPKSLKWRFHYLYLIFLALALGLSITSFAIPTLAEEEPEIIDPTPTDPELEDDPYMVQVLKELVIYVNESNTDTRFKDSTVKQLNDLIEVVINPDTTVNIAKMTVDALISQMEVDLKTSNTGVFVYDLVKNEDDPNVINIALSLKKLDVLGLAHQMDALRLQLDASQSIMLAASRQIYLAYGDKLKKSSLNQQPIYKESPLIKALVDLGDDLRIVNERLLNGGVLDQSEISIMMAENKKNLVDSLELQLNNVTVCEHVREVLLELFEMNDDDNLDPSRPNRPTVGPTDTNDTEKGDNEGGMGGGDILFGSDDLFFDPVLGYVKYGDVINAYQAIIDKDIKDGVLTEEMIAFYRDYYEKLMTNKDNNK